MMCFASLPIYPDGPTYSILSHRNEYSRDQTSDAYTVSSSLDTRVGNSLIGFLSDLLVFVSERAIRPEKISERAMSNLSKSLTVALL